MKKLLAILGMALLANVANANPLVPPAACPTVEALSAVGTNQAIPVENMWVMYQWKDKFGTADDWSLYVISMGYNQSNPADIIPEVNAKLINMKIVEGPVNKSGQWGCIYDYTEEDNVGPSKYMMAITITPPGAINGKMNQTLMHKLVPQK